MVFVKLNIEKSLLDLAIPTVSNWRISASEKRLPETERS